MAELHPSAGSDNERHRIVLFLRVQSADQHSRRRASGRSSTWAGFGVFAHDAIRRGCNATQPADPERPRRWDGRLRCSSRCCVVRQHGTFGVEGLSRTASRPSALARNGFGAGNAFGYRPGHPGHVLCTTPDGDPRASCSTAAPRTSSSSSVTSSGLTLDDGLPAAPRLRRTRGPRHHHAPGRPAAGYDPGQTMPSTSNRRRAAPRRQRDDAHALESAHRLETPA